MIAVDSKFLGFTDNSIISFWAEPIGFRNIYFNSDNLYNNTSNNNDEIEILEFLFKEIVHNIPIAFIIILEIIILVNLIKKHKKKK